MASINDLATAAIASSAAAAAEMARQASRDDGAPADVVGSSATTTTEAAAATPGHTVDATAGLNGSDPDVAIPDAPSPDVVRGALIALEGLDRSGKTTQVKLLEQRFVELGRKVKVMRFPDRTTVIGQMIDGYLKSQVEMDDHVIHLLFSANRWEAVKTITSLLASGTTVVCDRYYHSGIVYSAAKRNPDLSLTWARAPEVGLPRPDLVLFLDLDEAQAKARGGWGGEVYERGEMQRRVRELFWGLSMGRIAETSPAPSAAAVAGEAGGIGGGGPTPTAAAVATSGPELRFRQEEEDLHVVDASPSVEEVAEEIWKVVGPRVEAVERGEVGKAARKVC